MDQAKAKGGRPRKGKVEHFSVPPTDPVFAALAQRTLKRLSVDPTWTENLAEFFGDVITGTATERKKAHAGAKIIYAIEKAPIEALTELFSRITAMRKEAGRPIEDKHRHWHVLKGYLDYLAANNNIPPSKPELKEFLIAHKRIYKNLPDALDKPGWTQAWKGAELNDLSDRKVRSKP